jgi:hypothetical protein
LGDAFKRFVALIYFVHGNARMDRASRNVKIN